MITSQLEAFYNHIGLPMSSEPKDLTILKKSLLLELKESSDDGILINGTKWFKNDILLFFETGQSSIFDLNDLINDFPWVKNLYDLDKLTLRSDINDKLFEDQRFREFAKTEGRNLQEEYSRKIKDKFNQADDIAVATFISYLPCFEDEFILITLKTLKDLYKYKLSNLNLEVEKMSKSKLIEETKFLRSRGYYIVVKKILNDNSAFLEENVMLISNTANLIDSSLTKTAIKFQFELNHSEIHLKYLKDVNKQLLHIRQQVSRSQGDGFNHVGKILWAIVVVIIIIARVASSVNRNDYNNYKPRIPYEIRVQDQARRDSITKKVLIDMRRNDSIINANSENKNT
ncbi:MAG: hypothetical protein RLZ33_786 [Bacteroidota bacterium]